MKLLLFFLALVALGETTSAQNYSCISPEHKTFFTNASNYLRGMRIDSVKMIDGAQVSYPFKTNRTSANCCDSPADTAGASWLGGAIAEKEGRTLVPNIWSDTVKIKNDAALHESWIFYDDSSSVFFIAEIVDWSEVTVGGITDTAKIIQITANNPDGVIAGHPANEFQFVLSKSNGWLRVAELYTFPYGENGAVSADASYDWYLSNLISSGWNNLVFSRVDYRPSSKFLMYDYEAGDVFHSEHYNHIAGYAPSNTLDTITTRFLTGDIRSYIRQSERRSRYFDYTIGSFVENSNFHTDTISMSEEPMFAMDVMPEEWRSGACFYFQKDDSSFCHTSNKYAVTPLAFSETGSFIGFEWSPNTTIFKEGIGKIYESNVYISTGTMTSTRVTGARKGDFPCGSNNMPLSTNAPKPTELNYTVFPNPAADVVYIKFPVQPQHSYSIQLLDITGRVLLVQKSNLAEAKIELGNIIPGIYFVEVMGSEGKGIRKLVVR